MSKRVKKEEMNTITFSNQILLNFTLSPSNLFLNLRTMDRDFSFYLSSIGIKRQVTETVIGKHDSLKGPFVYFWDCESMSKDFTTVLDEYKDIFTVYSSPL